MNSLKMMVGTESRQNRWSQLLILVALLLILLTIVTNVYAADRDGDGILDDQDNCPFVYNPDQRDSDGNRVGDVCEDDTDRDGIPAKIDNCPLAYNPDQADRDGDGVGDACDFDSDNDGILDRADNCPLDYNPDQADGDGDGIGDACDPDSANEPPTAAAGGPYLVAINTAVPLDGTGTDPDGDPLAYQWSATGGALDNAAAEDPHYTAGGTAGVYEGVLTVTDPAGASASDTAMIVVFDPDGGFVTGGGWISSAAGACQLDAACAAATGKATFGFVSKYKKGASEPGGNTEFQFQAGNLNFHSSAYEWLVVNQDGTNAQFKGSGTINGAGDYKFMIWAGDGEPDQFRIKIWMETGDEETTVYDNGFDQPLEGGSIVIHN